MRCNEVNLHIYLDVFHLGLSLRLGYIYIEEQAAPEGNSCAILVAVVEAHGPNFHGAIHVDEQEPVGIG